MPDTFPHLPLLRESPVVPRRPKPAPIQIPSPANPRAFGERLAQSLTAARERAAEDIGGFDTRSLIKLTVDVRLNPDELKRISPEVEIVSQEDRSVVLAFATDAALAQFERRLASLAEGGRPTYQAILFALQSFDGWSAEDRTGWALRQEGWPAEAAFVLDVELWPIASGEEQQRMWQSFERWLAVQQIQRLDAVKQSSLLMYRVRTSRAQGETLLRHRDVRTVDLPPRWAMNARFLRADVADIPAPQAPPENAPGVVVLDSGIVQNHPLLASAVGDAQTFLEGGGAEDEHGHGTLVAGIALYGDVGRQVEGNAFVPHLRLFSGRVLDSNNQADERLIENSVEDAVRYFHEHYGCRVFNLSYGDARKPYRGGHIRGLAVTLDSLAREMGILFVVPTGNFEGTEELPHDWRTDYPGYLLHEDAALLDPAPALNVLTVGSLVRWDATFNNQRYRDDPAEQPIARHDLPSPFTRSGFSVGRAIKPDLLAYGGNWAVNVRAANQWIVHQGLGELSTKRDFVAGQLFGESSGTSFAAPAVAHLAARILSEHPDADANLLRALLIAHASWPDASGELLPDIDDKLRLCGYGRVAGESALRSNEQEVTLVAREAVPNRRHHFFEVPAPEEFWSGGRRSREITVALAYSPAVRTTRVAYKATRMEFRLVSAPTLDRVTQMFNAATSHEDYESIPELLGASVGARRRSAGTAQNARWLFRIPSRTRRSERLFVVVTRNDNSWAAPITMTEEAYALAVVLRDRENTEAQLYSQIQARITTRVRARVRV